MASETFGLTAVDAEYEKKRKKWKLNKIKLIIKLRTKTRNLNTTCKIWCKKIIGWK